MCVIPVIISWLTFTHKITSKTLAVTQEWNQCSPSLSARVYSEKYER